MFRITDPSCGEAVNIGFPSQRANNAESFRAMTSLCQNPYHLGPPLLTWFKFNPSIHYNVWDEIAYAFPNFNGYTVEVWEWISNFLPHLTGHVITYPRWE